VDFLLIDPHKAFYSATVPTLGALEWKSIFPPGFGHRSASRRSTYCPGMPDSSEALCQISGES
ncbi:MAG: hypothetical protein ACPG7R_01580, partial [Planctomycetota bacterium]